ncbi:unnamed protein product [Rotaria socialis]
MRVLYFYSFKIVFMHVHPESFGQLITTWEPNDKFGDPHDLALSVNDRSLYVGEIRPNRIDSFNVLN